MFATAGSSRAVAASGTIRLIVPGPGGARSGVAGRLLGAALQKELGGEVDVIAVDSPREGYLMLASARPDGSTYGLIGADMSALNRGIGGSPGVDSITPIAMTSVDPAGIHVRRDAPWRDAGELVAIAKAGTAPIKASGSGRQAVWHLSAHRLIAAAGGRAAALAWSASGTVADAAEMLDAGGTDIVVCSIPEVRATTYASRLRTLAVMSDRRSSRYPEVAAIAESGVKLSAGWWRGVAAPRGLDAQQTARMQAAVQRAIAGEAFRTDMVRRGYNLAWAGSAEFARFVTSEDQATAEAMRAIG